MSTRFMLALAVLVVVRGAAAQTAPTSAVRVQVGVEPEQVTVGEPFRSALRVTAPPEYRVEYGEVTSGDTLQALGPAVLTDTDGGGATATYPLVAWVAGIRPDASVSVRFVDPSGAARVQAIRLRLPEVVSVLPAGDDSIAPQPAKGVIVPPTPGRFPWWWLLLALVAALLAYWLYRQIRRRAVEPAIDPREWALTRLDAPETRALLASGDFPRLFQRVSWILRTYLFRVEPQMGLDLTTTELIVKIGRVGDNSPPAIRALGGEGGEYPCRELEAMLHAADRAKFARYSPTREESATLIESARNWITSHPAASPEVAPTRRAAA